MVPGLSLLVKPAPAAPRSAGFGACSVRMPGKGDDHVI
jgi:hypothetical protein